MGLECEFRNARFEARRSPETPSTLTQDNQDLMRGAIISERNIDATYEILAIDAG
jgi:hypothetical protein